MPMTREEVTTLAMTLMTQHGLTAKGWTFSFNTNKRRLGVCKFGTVMVNRFTRDWMLVDPVKRIELSVHTLHNSHESIQDTILHEIAHALAGPLAKHGPEWKRIARSIGCTAMRCGTFAKPADAPYVGFCFTCNDNIAQMYRRPTGYHRCRNCGQRIEWRHAGTGEPIIIVPRQPRQLRSLSKHFPAHLFTPIGG